jgi:hypothetical protein
MRLVKSVLDKKQLKADNKVKAKAKPKAKLKEMAAGA